VTKNGYRKNRDAEEKAVGAGTSKGKKGKDEKDFNDYCADTQLLQHLQTELERVTREKDTANRGRDAALCTARDERDSAMTRAFQPLHSSSDSLSAKDAVASVRDGYHAVRLHVCASAAGNVPWQWWGGGAQRSNA
jgi:hypothetical protein